jgi:DNA-binding HxlR family transcriptional regulator
MLGRMYEDQVCSAARTLEQVGERWSLLIIKEALFSGATRFREFQRALGIAPNILQSRLGGFVADGLMEQRPYSKSSRINDYVLTAKGRDLFPVLIALTGWGDRWLAPEGPPVVYTHADCGGEVAQHTQCTSCGADGDLEVVVTPGPGHVFPNEEDDDGLRQEKIASFAG